MDYDWGRISPDDYLNVIGLTASHPEPRLRPWPRFVLILFLLPMPFLTRYTQSFVMALQMFLLCLAHILMDRVPATSFTHTHTSLRDDQSFAVNDAR